MPAGRAPVKVFSAGPCLGFMGERFDRGWVPRATSARIATRAGNEGHERRGGEA
jgi:hypothetical protein